MRTRPIIEKVKIPVLQLITIGLLPSFIKTMVYRLRGYKIGKKVKIGIGSVIIGENVIIGDGTKIGFVTPIIGRDIEIGRYVKIGSLSYINSSKIFIDDDARINNQVIVGGIEFPDSELSLGKRTIVMENSILNPTRPLRVGDDTGIGGKCSIFTHGSWQNQLEGYPVTFAPVTLGKNVWIPWDVFIMPGITIGDDATIGAGALVNKDIPPGALAAGVPIKILKTKEQRGGRPSEDSRRDLIRQYLQSFHDQMIWYKVDAIDPISNNYCLTYSYRKGKKTFSVIYIEGKDSWESQLDHLPPKTTVCISLLKLNHNQQQYIRDNRQMWLDLDTRQRGGISNPIGEQLVMFLSRYGVRFSDGGL